MGLPATELSGHVENGGGFCLLTRQPANCFSGCGQQILGQISSFEKSSRLLVVFLGCDSDDDSGTGPNNQEIANEIWEVDIDDGEGDGCWVLTMFADSTVTTTGEFSISSGTDEEISRPFTNGPVVISDSSFSFTSTGTATFTSYPSMTSPFNLTVEGTTYNNGQANGDYTINFSAQEWPSEVSGTWTASRTSGGGITN